MAKSGRLIVNFKHRAIALKTIVNAVSPHMSKPKHRQPPIDLNDQFRHALDMMEHTTKSIFITGRAGTGKSTLLTYFRRTTKKKIAVLAPTGVAALNIKGQTIHSFFRFKPNITPNGSERSILAPIKRISTKSWMQWSLTKFQWSELICSTAWTHSCG